MAEAPQRLQAIKEARSQTISPPRAVPHRSDGPCSGPRSAESRALGSGPLDPEWRDASVRTGSQRLMLSVSNTSMTPLEVLERDETLGQNHGGTRRAPSVLLS